MEKTFSILTIGCKLNQFESEWIRQSLLRRNWEYRRFADGARFYIINSCTVTGKSDARSRNAVRRTRTAAPAAFIVVTGCYAETQPERLALMHEVDLVLGNRDKESIPAILDAIAAGRGGDPLHTASPRGARPDRSAIDCFLDHSRAFIKIQDGCNASCSYCIVPRARGSSRSMSEEAILDQARILYDNGYREIVLTGIHIGRYGADLDPPSSLAGLLEAILRTTDRVRIRLSSIEMTEVTPAIIELLRTERRIAPHLHIPLQSGDDHVLESMNRPYRAADYRKKIAELARARAGLAIGTDIIVGFPGETDDRFRNTYELVAGLPLSYFHIFSFSPRPGTSAATMAGQVCPRAKKMRSRRLLELGASKKRSFLESQIGATRLVLVEGPFKGASTFARSLTGNYCEVLIPRMAAAIGTLAPARVTHFSRGNLYGTLLDASARNAETGEDAW